jgi:hypothetical protein
MTARVDCSIPAAVACLLLVLNLGATPQQSTGQQSTASTGASDTSRKTGPASQQEKPAAQEQKSADAEPSLLDGVSTAGAARSAAHDRTAKSDTKEPEKASGAAVAEFHPASAAETAAKPVEVKSKKAGLKDVHGSAWGKTGTYGTGTHNTGGEIGAGSRSGKTHVYVSGEGSRTDTTTVHR